jgi:hypothetical protein
MKFGVAVLILLAFGLIISLVKPTTTKETKVIKVESDTTIFISKEELMYSNILILNN